MSIYRYGEFALPTVTQNAGTVITQLVPPWPGALGSPPLVRKTVANQKSGLAGYTRINKLVYTAGSTVHSVVVMRPLNYALVAADVAKNTTAVTLSTDPGLYSTSYKYPLASGLTAPGCVADNALAAGDYVAYQLTDGTWKLDIVSSGTYAAVVLTTGTPNVNGATITAGTHMYFFGISSDSDPSLGTAHQSWTSVVSARQNLLENASGGAIAALHAGDPLLIYSANASNAGTLSLVAGYYGQE